MNISLPDELRRFADHQVASHLYSSSCGYVRELIRRDRENVRLRQAVLDGIRLGDGSEMDATYFYNLRVRATGAP